MRNFLTGNYFAYLLILLIGISIATLANFNEVCLGGPDNYWHYYFSKYAFQYPKFFLHHWGKPFFILLSAPVSQLGFYALNIFNIICGLLSALLAYNWCKKLNLGYSFMAIVIVMFTPIYFTAIQSALTEPLFSLLLIYSAYLLFFEKYLWGTMVASTLMYARSEGIFIILIFAIYLIISGKYKYIPLLATAFLAYSFIGFFSGHDFLWYFSENPYKAVSPYGHGTWMHFISSYKSVFGKTFYLLFLIGFVILMTKIVRTKQYYFWKERGTEFKIFCLVFVPSLMFFIFHVYEWAQGKYASAGELRVMACIIPLASVITMFGINLIHRLKFPFIRIVFLMIIIQSIFHYTFKNYQYPAKAQGSEKAEIQAAEWFKTYRKPNSLIYYAHPGIIFHCDYNPFDLNNKECFSFGDVNSDTLYKNRKCYYIWDSQFSEFSCQTKLADIENNKAFTKIKEFNVDYFKLVFFESK